VTKNSRVARALITGATGFIGGSLAERLLATGCEVHAIVRPSSSFERTYRLASMGCTLHVHDGTSDNLEKIVARARPDCTWHLATKFIAEHVAHEVAELIRNNVEFGTMLLEALAGFGASPVVTTGTAWQQQGNAAYSPMSLYAATKQAFDAIATFYVEVHAMRIVECLLFDTYGPDDSRKKLLWALGEAVRSGVPLRLSGDGYQFIDLLQIDDVVSALLMAGDRAVDGSPGLSEQWAVRSGEALTVRELVERYGRVRGVTVPVEWGARPPRRREMFTPWTAGLVLPHWSPSKKLDDGLASL
jgi:nucleoside-diphosphate-sugar epimerase